MTSHYRQEFARPSALRRSHRRYPMQVDLEYKLLDGKKVLKTGAGRTLNLSSSGILFESGESLPIATAIRLSIAWPAQLNDRVGLTLCVMGRTVRSSGNCTAVEILSHEFRTRPLHAQQQSVKEITMAAGADMHRASA